MSGRQIGISIWIFPSANYLLGFLQTCTQIIQSHNFYLQDEEEEALSQAKNCAIPFISVSNKNNKKVTLWTKGISNGWRSLKGFMDCSANHYTTTPVQYVKFQSGTLKSLAWLLDSSRSIYLQMSAQNSEDVWKIFVIFTKNQSRGCFLYLRSSLVSCLIFPFRLHNLK